MTPAGRKDAEERGGNIARTRIYRDVALFFGERARGGLMDRNCGCAMFTASACAREIAVRGA